MSARRHVQYARIPQGAETCAFCLMLASRGFTYNSEEFARHAHSACDCRVVPGFKDETEVEGYDYKSMYNGYSNCRKFAASDISRDTWKRLPQSEKDKYKGESDAEQFNDYVMKQIVSEMRRHDPEWIRTGVITEAEEKILRKLRDENPERYAEMVSNMFEEAGIDDSDDSQTT